jgi:hypothetical protein
MKRPTLFAWIACGVLAPSAALAAPPEDVPSDGRAEAVRDVEPRPWVFLDDPTIPRPLAVTAFSRVTATGYGGTPTRPFGGDLAHPGAVLEMGAEAGLLPWMSVSASVFGSTFTPAQEGSSLGGMAGLRFAPFQDVWRSTRLVGSAGYLRDLAGGSGVWGRVMVEQDIGRARLGGMVHAEHVFAPGRDGADMMVTAGASYRVAGPLRLGVEYVAQDIEGAFDSQELEGMRHFLGPTFGLELLGKRLSIAGSPAVGLTSHSPPIVGRAAVAYAF